MRVAPRQPAVPATNFKDTASDKIGQKRVEGVDLAALRVEENRHDRRAHCTQFFERTTRMRIGIVGAGMIGSTMARLWVGAGHEIRLASRHPEALHAFVETLGPLAAVATPQQAARFGDVVMLTVPLSAMPALAADLAPLLQNKVVIDTGNAYQKRDGDFAREATSHPAGSAGWAASFFPRARWVKGFNTVYFKTLL